MSEPPVTTPPAPLTYGPPITLSQAKAVMAAAETEALAQGWAMVIAIVDSGGNLVMLQRHDNAQLGSIVVAQGKAETALRFKRATKVFQDAIASGGMHLRILGMANTMPLEGGIPLFAGGLIVGAIGVSGMASGQDAQVAEAGARVLAG